MNITLLVTLYLPHLAQPYYYYYYNQDEAMSKIIINPDHDIILRLNGCDLLVSLKVLSLASFVFKAMFKPYFKEDVEYYLQLGELLFIPLLEDNLEATTLSYQITHYRSLDLSRVPSLLYLAIFYNKYKYTGSIVICSTL